MSLSTRLLLWTAVLAAAACVLFLTWPELDLWVADWFYLGDNRFLLSHGKAWFYYKEIVRPAFRFLLAALAVWALWVLWRDPAQRRTNLRRIAVVLLVALLGPVLVVEAGLKSHSGRARPSDISQFGGAKTYSPPLVMSDQCERNCSFVSGDAAAAFASLALAVLALRRRGLWIAVAIFAGLAIGAVRMGGGKHFLSDVVFAGLVVTAITALCYRFLLEGRGPPAYGRDADQREADQREA
jgi:lipid A 4'-phosphatase